MNPLPVTPDDARAALNRVTNSPEFRGVERLKSFLRFVIEETLAGRGENIKEYSVGIEVFKKPADYDPRTDSTVRVEATKLRNRLKQYYEGSGSADSVLISIPKGGYQPVIELRPEPKIDLPEPAQVPAEPQPETSPPTPLPHRRISGSALVAAALLAGVLALGLWRGTFANRQPEPIRTYVTSFPGSESHPSFSPDGSLVAFAGDVLEKGNTDIYVKRVHGHNMLRLTSHPGEDTKPAWSPDGKYIAFIRDPGPGGAVYLISPNGGDERKLINVWMAGLAWTADSRRLAVLHRDSNIAPPRFLLVDIENGRMVPLTDPPSADYSVAFSPNGQTIAIVRCATSTACDIYTAPLNAGGTINGSPRRLTHEGRSIRGVAWTADSQAVVFSMGTGILYSNDYSLFFTDAKEGADRRVVPISRTKNAALDPTIPFLGSPGLHLLAFEESYADINIWRISLPGSATPQLPDLGQGNAIISSSLADYQPSSSWDGRMIAFTSNRSGSFEAWVAEASGSNPRQVTSFGDSIVLYPRWSPDSTRLTFIRISKVGDRDKREILTIQPDGKDIRPVTDGRDHVTEPTWSGDGQWIYHSSLRTGQYQIWKTKANGSGETMQITRQGGYHSQISSDGSALYYTIVGQGVWTVPANGGPERKLLPHVGSIHWAVVQDGIIFLERDPVTRGLWIVCRRADQTGKVERLGRLSRDPETINVDRSGRFLVHSRVDTHISDIVMLENYR